MLRVPSPVDPLVAVSFACVGLAWLFCHQLRCECLGGPGCLARHRKQSCAKHHQPPSPEKWVVFESTSASTDNEGCWARSHPVRPAKTLEAEALSSGSKSGAAFTSCPLADFIKPAAVTCLVSPRRGWQISLQVPALSLECQVLAIEQVPRSRSVGSRSSGRPGQPDLPGCFLQSPAVYTEVHRVVYRVPLWAYRIFPPL